MVRRVSEALVGGQTLGDVAVALSAEGVSAGGGAAWQTSTLSALVATAATGGRPRCTPGAASGRTAAPARWPAPRGVADHAPRGVPPLVSATLWLEAQEALEHNKKGGALDGPRPPDGVPAAGRAGGLRPLRAPHARPHGPQEAGLGQDGGEPGRADAVPHLRLRLAAAGADGRRGALPPPGRIRSEALDLAVWRPVLAEATAAYRPSGGTGRRANKEAERAVRDAERAVRKLERVLENTATELTLAETEDEKASLRALRRTSAAGLEQARVQRDQAAQALLHDQRREDAGVAVFRELTANEAALGARCRGRSARPATPRCGASWTPSGYGWWCGTQTPGGPTRAPRGAAVGRRPVHDCAHPVLWHRAQYDTRARPARYPAAAAHPFVVRITSPSSGGSPPTVAARGLGGVEQEDAPGPDDHEVHRQGGPREPRRGAYGSPGQAPPVSPSPPWRLAFVQHPLGPPAARRRRWPPARARPAPRRGRAGAACPRPPAWPPGCCSRTSSPGRRSPPRQAAPCPPARCWPPWSTALRSSCLLPQRPVLRFPVPLNRLPERHSVHPRPALRPLVGPATAGPLCRCPPPPGPARRRGNLVRPPAAVRPACSSHPLLCPSGIPQIGHAAKWARYKQRAAEDR